TDAHSSRDWCINRFSNSAASDRKPADPRVSERDTDSSGVEINPNERGEVNMPVNFDLHECNLEKRWYFPSGAASLSFWLGRAAWRSGARNVQGTSRPLHQTEWACRPTLRHSV